MSPEVRRAVLALVVLLPLGCRQDMHDQPKYEPLRTSPFFADGRASRPLVEGTVARGRVPADAAFHTGREGEKHLRQLPLPLTEALLRRGRERYDIYCAVCHDRVGNGAGMIVRRGFGPARSLHVGRLREAPDGYIFDVITNGLGIMPGYAAPIRARDRWAIVAYVRALQLSQGAALSDVPPVERQRLEGAEDRSGSHVTPRGTVAQAAGGDPGRGGHH